MQSQVDNAKDGLKCFEFVHFQSLPEEVKNAFNWIAFVM